MTPLPKSLLLLTTLVWFPLAVAAQDLDGVATWAAAHLQKALAELTAVRQKIESERSPLARQVTELENKLSARKAECTKAQRFQDNQLVELNALKADAGNRTRSNCSTNMRGPSARG